MTLDLAEPGMEAVGDCGFVVSIRVAGSAEFRLLKLRGLFLGSIAKDAATFRGTPRVPQTF